MKTGRLSKAERDQILSLAATTTVETIATRLDRLPETVAALIAKERPQAAAQTEIRTGLRSSPQWMHLRDEFDDAELNVFEERYAALKDQFRDDVLASEEGQLLKAVKAELLMHRNLVQQKSIKQEIERLEAEKASLIPQVKKNPEDGVLHARLVDCDTALRAYVRDRGDRTKEYALLDEGYSNVMKALKATREQRIAKVESGKRTFFDIIRELSAKEIQDRADRQIDQMKKAADKERRRLGVPHRYANGEFDRPILSADTVMMEG